MSDVGEWQEDVQGRLPVHKAVVRVLPEGTKVLSAEPSGTSAWTKTAKVSVLLPDGNPKRYFLKCASGQGARSLAEGEFHSASAIDAIVPGMVPKPIGWGEYKVGETHVYFIVSDYYDMKLRERPNPAQFVSMVADLHERGTSPNGMFGFAVTTVCGKMERTVTWTESWAESFSNQLKDVIKYDNETNGPWPEYDAACKQLLDVVIPRLLGALQSDGRDITPTLVHGDLWENNVGIDKATGNIVVFDPGCVYAHNEMEFGTWRCTWAFHFALPLYTRLYHGRLGPSEPVEEWDDRNRLYSIHPYLNDSAGHPGSISRQIAYNDMLYLCDKYGPLDSLEKYDPAKDVAINGTHIPFVINQLESDWSPKVDSPSIQQVEMAEGPPCA
ncbi:Fructosamine kinase-domain-containing protein [Diplogelasinospora grovesii]|uniref:protein-ribulosamine 3-kinase n=1 Tax=Diplogelasinospora grovesii TaxID=303347 RepID=A0AAN6S646_9PEZI|nr:Fructosamine kinase-domain-containing protein [Diplogelasinospora grovesii]